MIYILNPTKGAKPKKGGSRMAQRHPHASRWGYLETKYPDRKKKVKPESMKRRKTLQKSARYKGPKAYFRPKLMVDPTTGKVYASPLAGGSYIVNPTRKVSTMKKRRKTRKKYKRNPVALLGRRGRKVARRRYKRNPAILKQAFSKKHIVNIASLGVGFVGGIKAQKYINGMEALADYRKYTGVIPFILGTLVAVKGKKEAIKSVGAGISLSGLYDLITQNIPQLNLSTVEGVDLDDQYYDDMDGTVIDMDGSVIDLEGEDEMDVVGEEDTDYIVGSDSPYEMV